VIRSSTDLKGREKVKTRSGPGARKGYHGATVKENQQFNTSTTTLKERRKETDFRYGGGTPRACFSAPSELSAKSGLKACPPEKKGSPKGGDGS